MSYRDFNDSVVLQEQLETLIDTLQELIQRLAPLASAMTMIGGTALRAQVINTTAVSGPLTSAQFSASLTALATQNTVAVLSNIDNCMGV